MKLVLCPFLNFIDRTLSKDIQLEKDRRLHRRSVRFISPLIEQLDHVHLIKVRLYCFPLTLMEVQYNLEQFRELFYFFFFMMFELFYFNDCKAFSLTLCVGNWQGTSSGHPIQRSQNCCCCCFGRLRFA